MAVVVEQQQGRLLHQHPRDVVEPEIGAAEQAARAAQVEPVDRSPFSQQVPQVASPEVGERQVAQELHRSLGVAAMQG